MHNRKVTKNALTLTTQKSPLGVSLSLSHTHIPLPLGVNFEFSDVYHRHFYKEFPPGYRVRPYNLVPTAFPLCCLNGFQRLHDDITYLEQG